MRCWVRDHPVSENRLQPGTAAQMILSKPPQLDAIFDTHPDANPPSRVRGLRRWQVNPDRNWGPKPRAAKSGKEESVDDRRLRGAKKAGKNKAKRKADVRMTVCIVVVFVLFDCLVDVSQSVKHLFSCAQKLTRELANFVCRT